MGTSESRVIPGQDADKPAQGGSRFFQHESSAVLERLGAATADEVVNLCLADSSVEDLLQREVQQIRDEFNDAQRLLEEVMAAQKKQSHTELLRRLEQRTQERQAALHQARDEQEQQRASLACSVECEQKWSKRRLQQRLAERRRQRDPKKEEKESVSEDGNTSCEMANPSGPLVL